MTYAPSSDVFNAVAKRLESVFDGDTLIDDCLPCISRTRSPNGQYTINATINGIFTLAYYPHYAWVHTTDGFVGGYNEVYMIGDYPVRESIGSRALAMELGFSGVHAMESWLGNNPNVWGNRGGCDFLFEAVAYDCEYTYFRVRDISRRFREVASRL